MDNEGYSDNPVDSQVPTEKISGKKGNNLPIYGNERSMNINPLILTSIKSSSYFKVNLYGLKTYHEVIDEISKKVSHLEPWEKGTRNSTGQTGMCGGVRGVGAGGIVSTAYCLLYKLFTLRLTREQVKGLINHTDSPYIRALGFMYIRYTQPPGNLLDWFKDYLQDPEELDVKAGGGQFMTIGDMLRHFLTKLEWFSTLFPKIPVPIQQKIDKKINVNFLSTNTCLNKPGKLYGAWNQGPPTGLFSSEVKKQVNKKPYVLTNYSKVDINKNLVEYDVTGLINAARHYYQNFNFIQASEKLWLAGVTIVKKKMYSIKVKVSSHSGISECANLLLTCVNDQSLGYILDMKDNWYALERLHQFHYGDTTCSRIKFKQLMEDGEKFINCVNTISEVILKNKFWELVKNGTFILDELTKEVPLKFAKPDVSFRYIFIDRNKRQEAQNQN